MSRFSKLYRDPDDWYFIAEVGGNHEGDLTTAVDMVDAAARAGADAVKFQWYKVDRLVTADAPAYWDTSKESAQTQRALFDRCDGFGEAEFEILRARCWARGVDFLCTPFDPETVPLLDRMGVPAFKIASADLTNLPLLEAVRATGKPVILSTGASTAAEIAGAVDRFRQVDVGVLHCVLNYPTAPHHANLRAISRLRDVMLALGAWILPIHEPRWAGWSDHVVPLGRIAWSVVVAYLMGARIIEKHFTLDYSQPGNDHYHSMDPKILRATRETIDGAIRPLLGTGDRDTVGEHEQAARLHARRSVVTTRDLEAGHVLTAADLTLKRPGHGFPPAELARLLGVPVSRAVAADTVLTPEDLGVGVHA